MVSWLSRTRSLLWAPSLIRSGRCQRRPSPPRLQEHWGKPGSRLRICSLQRPWDSTTLLMSDVYMLKISGPNTEPCGTPHGIFSNLPDPQTSDMRQIRQMMLALPLSSARLRKLWILCLNNLLDEELCKNIFYFYIFSFFSGFQTWFYRMHWFYLYPSFKHSKWWRH